MTINNELLNDFNTQCDKLLDSIGKYIIKVNYVSENFPEIHDIIKTINTDDTLKKSTMGKAAKHVFDNINDTKDSIIDDQKCILTKYYNILTLYMISDILSNRDAREKMGKIIDALTALGLIGIDD